ncbi:PREDICTED: 39S ribosomal protein L46, mitochondrial [Nicrophorus vespilloides]|uniref:Large ribosomal subunit protein mL46 n=1 Tax=Nicrophorus vespilloides TaxID=110193 RepID=A0ABM1NCY2_NICVS|nr:PREDICTED: 39S ribosomal protein L46, mitochondrial [Nicrophorus vespilloides]
MLRLTLNCINSTNRGCCTAATGKWDLITAVCLERRPIIGPEMSDMEKQFSKQLSEIELERSHKSKHEVEHEKDLKQLELIKRGDVDVEVNLKQTAQDFADTSLEELNKFKFASKQSDDTNVKSLNRKLDRHLVLLTQQKVGNDTFFLPPQGFRQDGETLRQTAERVLKESVGKDVQAQIYGNAPTGFYKYKYPKSVREVDGNSVGAKVFIYFARYANGSPSVSHKWLDREELRKELPEKYSQSLDEFLIDEQ